MSIPTAEDFRKVFEATASLSQDESLLDHVRQRFHSKYLEAVMRARGEVAVDRAWEGFYFWMVFPATNRKPFEIPVDEADALIGALRPLVQQLRDSLTRKPS